jgi:hypothetical protein
MKIIALLFILLYPLINFSQNIKEYYIYCDINDFEHIYLNYAEDIYIPIQIKYED